MHIMTTNGWMQLAPRKMYTPPSTYEKKPWHHDYDRNQDPQFAPLKITDNSVELHTSEG